jgi:hypothetical protein
MPTIIVVVISGNGFIEITLRLYFVERALTCRRGWRVRESEGEERRRAAARNSASPPPPSRLSPAPTTLHLLDMWATAVEKKASSCARFRPRALRDTQHNNVTLLGFRVLGFRV